MSGTPQPSRIKPGATTVSVAEMTPAHAVAYVRSLRWRDRQEIGWILEGDRRDSVRKACLQWLRGHRFFVVRSGWTRKPIKFDA